MAKKDDDEPEIDSVSLLNRLTDALDRLGKQNANIPDPALGEMMLTLAAAMERVADANIAGSKMIADETRRAHRPSNEVVPMRSVYNRRGQNLEGYTKPKLRCPTFMPWQLDDDSLMREEVELLNLLEQGEFTVIRNDESEVQVTIQMIMALDRVTPSRVLLNHETAFNQGSHREMPSMVRILRQILSQSSPEAKYKASAVLSDREEAAMIAAGELTVSV